MNAEVTRMMPDDRVINSMQGPGSRPLPLSISLTDGWIE
jgi:hypothetical protein